jgi:hypothetical protein
MSAESEVSRQVIFTVMLNGLLMLTTIAMVTGLAFLMINVS